LSGTVYLLKTTRPVRLSKAVTLPRKMQQRSIRCTFSCDDDPTSTSLPTTMGLLVMSDHRFGSICVIQRRAPAVRRPP